MTFNRTRIDPIRQFGLPLGPHRHRLSAECDDLRARIDELDRQMAALAGQRRQLRQALVDRHRTLLPNFGHFRGRQPDPDGTEQLPPLPFETVRLWGRRLRSVCLALLRAGGALPLPALHALLHRHGYEIDSTQPVKALADALGYEVQQGRARRLRRGLYEVSATTTPRLGRHGNPGLLPLHS